MLGPVEYLSAQFTEEQFIGTMAAALNDLVQREIVHVVDLVFVHKSADGVVTVSELDELDVATSQAFDSISGEYGGLLSDEDIASAAADIEPGSGEVLLVWENIWEKGFFQKLRDAGGVIAEDVHIPDDAAEAAFSSLPTA